MAGSAQYTVVLDACTLYSSTVRNLLLTIGSETDLYHARWTKQIQQEWFDNLIAKRPDLDAAKLRTTQQQMTEAIPDSEITNHEPLIECLELPDKDDNHVLAAAIVGHADAIVTFNTRDFPAEYLATFNIEAQHPDDFVVNQLELHTLKAIGAIKVMRQKYRKPALTVEDFIARLERNQLPLTAAWLRNENVSRLI